MPMQDDWQRPVLRRQSFTTRAPIRSEHRVTSSILSANDAHSNNIVTDFMVGIMLHA